MIPSNGGVFRGFGKKLRLGLLICTAAGAVCSAGMRRDPVPHAITSPGGHYVFLMIPGPKGVEQTKGRGVCYSIEADGTLLAQWRTAGWYSEDLELAYDGMVLMRTGSWASGDQETDPVESTLAMAFYREGRELKRYQVGDLVQDRTKLVPTSAGWWWKYGSGRTEWHKDRESIHVVSTADGLEYRFSLATGEIVGMEHQFTLLTVLADGDETKAWRANPDVLNATPAWDGAGAPPFDKRVILRGAEEWCWATYQRFPYETTELGKWERAPAAEAERGWFCIVTFSNPNDPALPKTRQVVVLGNGSPAAGFRVKKID